MQIECVNSCGLWLSVCLDSSCEWLQVIWASLLTIVLTIVVMRCKIAVSATTEDCLLAQGILQWRCNSVTYRHAFTFFPNLIEIFSQRRLHSDRLLLSLRPWRRTQTGRPVIIQAIMAGVSEIGWQFSVGMHAYSIGVDWKGVYSCFRVLWIVILSRSRLVDVGKSQTGMLGF